MTGRLIVFMDTATPGGPGGEPWVPHCRSCRQTFSAGETTSEIRFERTDDPKLRELNGTYHKACAEPILKVKRTFDTMRRLGGGF